MLMVGGNMRKIIWCVSYAGTNVQHDYRVR